MCLVVYLISFKTLAEALLFSVALSPLLAAAPLGRELRLRCVARPDRAQAFLLDLLSFRLPEQLRMPRGARTR